jgi:hypothetical protein
LPNRRDQSQPALNGVNPRPHVKLPENVRQRPLYGFPRLQQGAANFVVRQAARDVIENLTPPPRALGILSATPDIGVFTVSNYR